MKMGNHFPFPENCFGRLITLDGGVLKIEKNTQLCSLQRGELAIWLEEIYCSPFFSRDGFNSRC